MSTSRYNWGAWHTCPVCGKKKYISHPADWVYKGYVDGKYHTEKKLFCSWSCLRKHEADHPPKKRSAYERGED